MRWIFSSPQAETFDGFGEQQRAVVFPIHHGGVEINEVPLIAKCGEQPGDLFIMKSMRGHLPDRHGLDALVWSLSYITAHYNKLWRPTQDLIAIFPANLVAKDW